MDLLTRLRFDEGKINQAKGPAPTDPKTTSNQDEDSRKLTVEWLGEPNITVGKVSLDGNGQGAGRMTMNFSSSGGSCSGNYAVTSGLKGTWSVSCNNGKSASGVFTSLGAGAGAMGTGTDNEGKKFNYEIGPRT